MSLNVKQALQSLGKIDGGIAALALSWSQVDPTHIKIAILVAGVAGGLGVILNYISRFVGGTDVVVVDARTVPTIPPPPPTNPDLPKH